MRVQARFFSEICGQVPIVPAMIATEQNQISSCRAAGDPDGHGACLAARLRIANHLGAGDALAKFLCQFDF